MSFCGFVKNRKILKNFNHFIKKQKATPGFEPGVKALQASALPLGQVAEKKWSGRRDSNSRQSAWKADTLPTELLPHAILNFQFHSVGRVSDILESFGTLSDQTFLRSVVTASLGN